MKVRLVKGTSKPEGIPPAVDWGMVADTFLWKTYNEPLYDSPRSGGVRKQGVFHPSAGLSHETDRCVRGMVFDLFCAPRSRTNHPSKLHKIFHMGHDRHNGLHLMFSDMAREGHLGITKYEQDIVCKHPTLPIAGEADGRVTFSNGWTYVLDFKTIGDGPASRNYGVTPNQKLQLTTYMGLLGEKVGYIINENKNNCAWLGPSEKYRVGFDQEVFEEIESFCSHVMREFVLARKLPMFDEGACKANRSGCAYTQICDGCRQPAGIPVHTFDRRTPELRKWHGEEY